MSSRSKSQIEVSELADLLYEHFVVKRAVNLPSKLKIPEALETPMRTKIALYQYASVSLAIAVEQQNDFALRFVEQKLSRLPLAPNPSELLSAIKTLGRILGTADGAGYATWASEWLSEIGVHETNPAVLGMFTYGWVQHHLLAIQTLKGVALLPTS
jgi:hypothetical protein